MFEAWYKCCGDFSCLTSGVADLKEILRHYTYFLAIIKSDCCSVLTLGQILCFGFISTTEFFLSTAEAEAGRQDKAPHHAAPMPRIGERAYVGLLRCFRQRSDVSWHLLASSGYFGLDSFLLSAQSLRIGCLVPCCVMCTSSEWRRRRRLRIFEILGLRKPCESWFYHVLSCFIHLCLAVDSPAMY